MANSPFNYIKNIQTKKEYDEELSGFNPWITETLFSTDSNYVFLVSMGKKSPYKQSKRALYDFYYYTIPKSNKWLKYPKKEDLTTLKYVQEYYQINDDMAADYMQFLSKKELDEIILIMEQRKGIDNV